MPLSVLGALLLATLVTVSTDERRPDDFENPRFVSPNGEYSFVIRRYPGLGDFDRVSYDDYWKRDPVDEWLDAYPRPEESPSIAKPEPVRGALYRHWPSGHPELLSVVTFSPDEPDDRALVSDEGYVVSYDRMLCGAKTSLLTIRDSSGSVVRSLRSRDLVTRNDQDWLCRGRDSDVRFSIDGQRGDAKLRATMLVTEGKWDDAEARFEIVEIDLATGETPKPLRDHCPSALTVVAEADVGQTTSKSYATVGESAAFGADDVVPIASQTLLERVVVQTVPEYPEVAVKARIAGNVRVVVVVDARGRVEAARVQAFPFGIDAAVQAAILTWEFQPDPNGARLSGSFVFRFEILRSALVITQPIASHRASPARADPC